jgi:hypothetical protein
MWAKSIISLIFAGAGAMLIYGAHRRWRWLVNPDMVAWPFYSQSFLKRLFGQKAALGFTYLSGFSMIAVGCWLFLNNSN